METRYSKYIRDTLQTFIHDLEGEFVVPKNGYEQAFSDVLLWNRKDGRYFDATDQLGTKIELKKGQSGMWFDLCRYAEIYEGKGDQDTYTVFLKWNKKKLKVMECYVIDTKVLMEQFGFGKNDWRHALRLKSLVPRSLNMLASLTWKDMRRIATHVIVS